MPENPEGDKPPDHTLVQPEEAVEGSKELSIPSGVEQHASAPKIKDYILTQPLGQGAFAEVWKGWQIRTRKWVAVKIFTQREGVNWLFLQREVERLIRLDRHPNIVSLLDADLTGNTPYYVMDYMEGGSLETVMEDGRMPSVETVTQWMREVADALRFVHAKGLIHCDLKPANILIDSEGRARVADFGQSRIVTESAGALGTLFYMAPEQASQEAEPDTKWDLYGLGTTFTAVLTGKTPRGEARGEIEKAEDLGLRLRAYRRLVEEDPLPPLQTATMNRVDQDLSAIIGRLLEADPENRYLSIDRVISDLDARRDHLPVAPLAANPWYRFKRFLQRNALVVAIGTVAVVGLGAAVTQVIAKNRALQGQVATGLFLRGKAALARSANAEAAVLFAKSNEAVPSLAAAAGAVRSLESIESPVGIWRLPTAVESVSFSPDGKRGLFSSQKGALLVDLVSKRPISQLSVPELKLMMMGLPKSRGAFNSDGARAFWIDGTGRILLIDGVTGSQIAGFEAVNAVFHPTQGLMALSVGGDEKKGIAPKVLIVSAIDGKVLRTLDHGGKEISPAIDFFRDGRLLSYQSGRIRVWDPTTGEEFRNAVPPKPKPKGRLLRARMIGTPWVRISREGNFLLVQLDRYPTVYDLRTRERVKDFPTNEGLRSVAFGESYRDTVAFGGERGGVLVMSHGRPQSFDTRVSQTGEITAMAFSEDADILATASEDGRLILRSDAYGVNFDKSFIHSSAVRDIEFSPDGKWMLTAARDGVVRLWRISDGKEMSAATIDNHGSVLAPVPGGGVAVVHQDTKLGFLDLKTGERSALSGLANFGNEVSFPNPSVDASGLMLLRQWNEPTIQVFSVREKKLIQTLKHGEIVKGASMSFDGTRAVTAGEKRLTVWDALTGKAVGEPLNLKTNAFSPVFSPDGTRIAFSDNKEILIYRVGSWGKPESRFQN